ncbi:MAG: type IV pilus twitching motility protein PilT [Chloroflexota bacterium]|nr:type IV pilus twitching motility protein PilT [Chloroflexota bacterium]
MNIDELLRIVIEREASDLHLKVGSPPVLRIDGELVPYAYADPIGLTSEDLKRAFDNITSEEQKERFAEELELDFAYSIPAFARFRVNAALQRGTITLAFRRIAWNVPSIKELGLPDICKALVLKPRGCVIITGPAGSGKSTTLAAMIEYLNERERRLVVTIEDPIEYLIRDRKCLITQRELGTDTRSFATALKHALRQDPDVILVGEMRDLETIATALTAAETGHLVLSTLHTPSAPQAIDRMIDVFPPHQQRQIRVQTSTTLQGVLYQTLLPVANGQGRVPAVEVMLATPAIRNLIREGKVHQIPNIIQTGAQYGMQTLNQALADLCQRGLVSREDALARSSDPQELLTLMKVRRRR